MTARYPPIGATLAAFATINSGRAERDNLRGRQSSRSCLDVGRQLTADRLVSDGEQLGQPRRRTTDQLAPAMRHQLARIQRRPALINEFLGQTRLTLDPQPQ